MLAVRDELFKSIKTPWENDWCAIRYAVTITNKQTGEKINQMTMEFVHFKDNPEPAGARDIEGGALSDTPIKAE